MDQRYLTIQRWGKNLDSKPYYIDAMVQHAINDNAPSNAIYRLDNGSWRTAEQIQDHVLRDYILTGI